MNFNSYDFNEFCQIYGKLMFFSQFIENDLRLIYCLKNTKNIENFNFLYQKTKEDEETKTFGKLLNLLKYELKNDNIDINLIYKALEIRNFWVHENIINIFYNKEIILKSKKKINEDLKIIFSSFKVLNEYKNFLKNEFKKS